MTVMPVDVADPAGRILIRDHDGRRDPGANGPQAVVRQTVVEWRERHSRHRGREQQGRDLVGVGRHHPQPLHARLLDQGGHSSRSVQQRRVGQPGRTGSPPRPGHPSRRQPSPTASRCSIVPSCLDGSRSPHAQGDRGRSGVDQYPTSVVTGRPARRNGGPTRSDPQLEPPPALRPLALSATFGGGCAPDVHPTP